MSRPPARRRPDEESRRPPNCAPNDGPSLGTIIAGIAGIAGAVGLGYLLGATSRDEEEETDRERSIAERRRQQQQQQRSTQQPAPNHSYYPAQYGNRSQQQHTEIKEATDHSHATTATAAYAAKINPSPLHHTQPSSSSSDPSVATASRALHPSQSVPVSSGSDGNEDADTCKICYDAPLDAVLFPCRHQCCCYACSEQLNECPVCRAPFTSAVKIYRS